MNRRQRRAEAKTPAELIAAAMPMGVVYFDPRFAMAAGALGAANDLAKAHPLRQEQRDRLRSAARTAR